MANSSINLTSLDFDTLKDSLISYLRTQEQFKDYDFSGSNLNVLMDLLSYNTFLNSFYLNMVASEAFLDTAQLDTSVFSHAKELNYVPRSARSAKATLNLSFKTTSDKTTVIIPKGTSFSARVGLESYNFYTDSTQVYHSTNITAQEDLTLVNNWTIQNVDVYEGSYVTDSFVIDYSLDNQRFILSNENVDISTLVVKSIENDGANIVTYLRKNTLLDLDALSQAFFVQGAETGKYEVVFGDDIIGRRPKNGAIITIEYRVSSGFDPNGAKVFTLNQDITDGKLIGKVTATTVTSSMGGSTKESVSSIKYNAPRYFQTQERAVSYVDYETLMKIQFPEINAIAVYGGETIEPPRFGKVIVSVDISNVDGFPDSKKQLYYNFLKPRMPLTQEPIFVSPSKIYYAINSLIRYNVNLTSHNPSEIATLVKNSIYEFDQTNLNKFNAILRYSQLTSAIDDADNSILGNETELFLYKKLYPKLSTPQNIRVNFNVPLLNTLYKMDVTHPGTDLHTIYSSEFFFNGESVYLEDDSDGKLRIVKSVGNTHTTVKEIGTVDYDTGVLNLVNFDIDYYVGSEFKIYAVAAEKDIYTGQNDILSLELDEVNLTVQAVRE